MAGKRLSKRQKTSLLRSRDLGLSMTETARRAGVSVSTVHRIWHAIPPGTESKALADNPPKPWVQLDPLARDCLADFATFCRVVFARDVPPWRADAARRVLDLVLDPVDRYGVLNAPSGSGKTTLMLDVIAWLLAGGGSRDPGFGRSLRLMYGHGVYEKAVHGVELLREVLASPAPYYDHKKKVHAEKSMVELFGRFRPVESDLDMTWRRDKFVVASLEDEPVFNKEPSVQAISYGSTFLNERADFIVLDDVVTPKNVGDPGALEWLNQNPESRLEPGGTLVLVGQRLASEDLYGDVLARTWDPDDDGDAVPVYAHFAYPAHHEPTCDADSGGNHRQWDLKADGCLLDARRLPWRKLQHEAAKPTFAAMYQQAPEESTAGGLVDLAWINGGVDSAGLEAVGCLDRDRGFWTPVQTAGGKPLVTYLTIDPAEGSKEHGASWWSLELWQVDSTNRVRFLVYGTRLRGTYSDVLSYDPNGPMLNLPATPRSGSGGFTGVLEETVFKAATLGARPSALVVEDNKARGWLASSDFQRWHRERWPDLKLIRYQVTAQNKNDPVTGVRGLLANDYRNGLARWPWKGMDALDYLRVKLHELTALKPRSNDTVMAEWVGAVSMDNVIAAASRAPTISNGFATLPPYLARKSLSNPDEHPAFTHATWIEGMSR
jgi:hypothetical protein